METTVNQTTKTKPNYKAMVEEGLKTLDKLLVRIEMNQSETAIIRNETEEIAVRVREKMKELSNVG